MDNGSKTQLEVQDNFISCIVMTLVSRYVAILIAILHVSTYPHSQRDNASPTRLSHAATEDVGLVYGFGDKANLDIEFPDRRI